MHCNLHSLPNEILIQIFTLFPTRSLISLAPTSILFSSIVLRILHQRLLLASSLPHSYSLILKAYHPTHKYSEPYLLCTYLGTPGLFPSPDRPDEDASCVPAPCSPSPSSMGAKYATVAQLYMRFRPEPPDVEDRRPTRPDTSPTGSANQTPGDSTTPSSSSSSSPLHTDNATAKISRRLTLEPHELFSQFYTTANLLMKGLRPGPSLTAVKIEEKVMRVWRRWLEDRARVSQSERAQGDRKIDTDDVGQDASILWTDSAHTVGLRVAVTERRRWHRHQGPDPGPMLVFAAADEEEDGNQAVGVTYELEIKELVIRTTHVMVTVEESVAQRMKDYGKTTIFASVANMTTA